MDVDEQLDTLLRKGVPGLAVEGPDLLGQFRAPREALDQVGRPSEASSDCAEIDFIEKLDQRFGPAGLQQHVLDLGE